MADEAVILNLAGQPKGVPISFTIAQGESVEKGTLMALSGEYMVRKSSAYGDIFAGIADAEKKAGEGTTIGLWTKGVFDLKASGAAILTGTPVLLSGVNIIASVENSEVSGSAVARGVAFGKALEDATTATAETIAVAIGIYS